MLFDPSSSRGRVINSSMLESGLKMIMSKSHANMASFDENVSYFSTLMNIYERNEQFLMNETAIEHRTNISTTI